MKIRHHLRKWLREKHGKDWEHFAKAEHAEHFVDGDLAFPEYHTGKVQHTDPAEHSEESIRYENVAIPEVHIPQKKR